MVNRQPEAAVRWWWGRGAEEGTISSRFAACASLCDSAGWRAQSPSCRFATGGNNICSGADEGLCGFEWLKVVVNAPV